MAITRLYQKHTLRTPTLPNVYLWAFIFLWTELFCTSASVFGDALAFEQCLSYNKDLFVYSLSFYPVNQTWGELSGKRATPTSPGSKCWNPAHPPNPPLRTLMLSKRISEWSQVHCCVNEQEGLLPVPRPVVWSVLSGQYWISISNLMAHPPPQSKTTWKPQLQTPNLLPTVAGEVWKWAALQSYQEGFPITTTDHIHSGNTKAPGYDGWIRSFYNGQKKHQVREHLLGK